ncbi:MAG: hypothetical protein IKK45_06200 [Akkermansia sp.]|nr:hypothetical protein [Akkermansia sp.]
MKPHLPVLLRKCLLAAFSLLCATTQAGVMHEDVHLQTYTDYGQNKGRYVVGERVNALVDFIRTEKDKGIGIYYTDGTTPYFIPIKQGMISFSGTGDGGPYAAIAPNSIVTVAHNGTINASYGEREVGVEHAINYKGIDIRHTEFRHKSSDDYMLQRQSKLQVDAAWNPLAYITEEEEKNSLVGDYVYHSGGGSMGVWKDGVEHSMGGAYTYIIGGLFETREVVIPQDDKFTTRQYMYYSSPEQAGASLTTPLPNGIRGGDSGSPTYRYNETLGRYEFLGSYAVNSGASVNWSLSMPQWTEQTLNSFGKSVDFGTENTVYLNAVSTEGDYIENNGYSTTLWSGTVQSATGVELARYNGLRTGLNTWADLSDLKDTQNWYAYDADLYDASKNPDGKLLQTIEDLFYTENLEFTANSGEEKRIILRDSVDLGIGYAGFTGGSFTIVSEAGEENVFNHAGYVVNEGAAVHMQFTNPESHMTEWRKMGAGELYIDGTGDTHALLNLGGTGRNYLQQKDGYAAYNVLVNTGATVVIADTGQIKRDFTFGTGGGTLDLNGNRMDWYTSSADKGYFTINALTEEAMISNSNGHATLTYKEAGEATYLGSFRDTAEGALTIDYQGGGVLCLHGIHTDLSHNTESGFIVSNGKVVLSGINTVHGMGSLSGNNAQRAVIENDWHYADATMNVSVANGATFELGSHARLKGNVTVETGGTYVMREGVKERFEYVEGHVFTEDTNEYRDYFGHKGDVVLKEEARMQVEFSEGTTSSTLYSGNISGSGSLTVNTGKTGGILYLEGNNTFSGKKVLQSGGLVGTNTTSLGNTTEEKWLVESGGWIASQKESAESLLARVDAASSGTLALSTDEATQLDLETHKHLYLGAEYGQTVQYGTSGTETTLKAVDGSWRLGGGGGELVVNYKLTGNNNLLLGADDTSTGVVTLTNKKNDFNGDIFFNGTGIILNATSSTLGNAKLHLNYGNAFNLANAEVLQQNITTSADGMILVDALEHQDLDLSQHASLALAAGHDTSYSGNITLADGQEYIFSSDSGATLTLAGELEHSRALVVDAQGQNGGTVILAGNDSWSGDITVRGHRDNNGTGEICLALGQDVVSTGTIKLEQGGYLDLAGHNLTVQGNLQSTQSYLVDSTSTGTLILDNTLGAMSIEAPLSLHTVRKIGEHHLLLNGANDIHKLYVDSGTLKIGNNAATTLGNTLVLADGTTLDTAGYTVRASVKAEEGTVNILGAGSTSSIAGDIALGNNVHLNFQENTKFTLQGNHYGGHTATMETTNSTLALQNGTYTNVEGLLLLNGDVRIESIGSANNMKRHLEKVQLNGGKLTLWEQTWNTIWEIDSLSGSGELHWDSHTNHSSSARLILRGAGDFNGSISMERTYSNSNRTHQAYLELASDAVAKNAHIHLQGTNANAVASLAINTENAQTKGLSGNAYSFVYAGESVESAAMSGAARPASTRTATLSLDTDTNHTFSGTLGNTSDSSSAGLSLVKTGTGIQTFNGASAVLNNISALAGTLNINTTALTIHGDVTLAGGATLNLGESFSLNAGQCLSLQRGAEGSGQAVLNSTLVLNGGSLSIDAGGLSTSSPLLSLSSGISMGSNFGSNCQLDFTHSAPLSFNTTYQISDGDWSSLAPYLSLTCAEYASATLTATSSGLSVTFNLNNNYIQWTGDEKILQAGSKILFTDSVENNHARLTAAAAAEIAIFENEHSFTISSENGSEFSLGEMRVAGTGELQVNTSVNATNMLVADSATIGGSGTLSVDSLTLESDLTTRMGIQLNTLRANGKRWTLDGSQNAFTQNLSLEQANTIDAIRVEGQATLELEVTSASTLTTEVSGSGSVALTGGGSLEKNQQEHINLSKVELTDLTLKGGSTDFTGEATIAGRLSIAQEEVRFTEGAQVTTNHYRSGDTADGQPSTISIERGASLTITGDTDSDSTSASFLLAHWKNSFSTLTLNGGTLTAKNTRLLMGWDSGGHFEALSGEAHLKGILFSDARNHAETLILGDARLNIGSGGITGMKSNDTVQLGNGTIAATADFSISGGTIELVGSGSGTVFDTNGHSITLNSAISGIGSVVKNGTGTLILGSNALSVLENSSIVVNKGVLDLSAASASSTLLDHVSGAGTVKLSYDMTNGNGTAFDFRGLSGTVQLEQGRILLSSSTFGEEHPDFVLNSANSQLVFAGTGTHINSNITLGAGTDIHANKDCSGEISGSVNGNYALTKRGAGTLKLSGGINLATLRPGAGTLILSGKENTVGMLDISMARSADGTIQLEQDAELNVSGKIWARNNTNTAIVLKQGASLSNTEDHVILSNRNSQTEARMVCTASDAEYSILKSDFVFSNGHLEYTAGDATLGNTLTHSSVENSGNGILIVDNSQNTLSGLHATGGSINVLNMTTLDLKELEIASSLSIGVYAGSTVAAEQEAHINVSSLASFGSGATLNADLALKSGATLCIESSVKMGSDVRLETGLSLSGAQYNALQHLKAGDKITLFTGIDALYLGAQTEPSSAFALSDGVQASDYFTNLTADYFLEYDTSKGEGEGTLSIGVVVPEPATATLSLLALAALAARRRRG